MIHMKQRKTFLDNNLAASPVIGVMLMVVVTVILAAAVSSYSGGLVSGTKTAPSATFEVQIKKGVDIGGENISFMKIKEITGDSIDTKDLKIITSYTGGNNDFYLKEVYPNVDNTDVVNGNTPIITSVSPYWSNPAIGEFGQDEEVNFGNYILRPGVVMIADCNENDVSSYDTGIEAVISGWENISSGDFITVSLVDIPSGKVIFESDVEVV
ncbi:type IV pilin N-terminal domain-containing protein [Methanolobus sp. WCC1]|uniref:type IV pilin N-terminal domain-containing protein n=1 Tax=unclassified Methanolobus TaxID=2629569 RepID=UPI002588FAD8|nr:type IV pilin N-terminal domain-containing protein [Methanolobus sp.]MDK2830430.1 archaeal type pilus assembly protein PilA [Methanolobus sp.]